MNIEKLKHYWHPVMRMDEIQRKPKGTMLLGVPVVVALIERKLYAFENRCPHRNVPLSGGRIHNGCLQCGYHGWMFDRGGELKHVPGGDGLIPSITLESFGVHEYGGIVWIRLLGEREFSLPFEDEVGLDYTLSVKELQGDFIHAIENFLDPTHTSYIHAGLLRSDSPQRMEISQQITEEGFSTLYTLLDRQNGWVNRLFDQGIDQNLAIFALPGSISLRYLQKGRVLFEVALHFTPLEKGSIRLFVRVGVKHTWVPSQLKFLLLRPFLEWAFLQDRKILKQQYESSVGKEYCIASSDLAIDHLIHFLADGPAGIKKSFTMKL